MNPKRITLLSAIRCIVGLQMLLFFLVACQSTNVNDGGETNNQESEQVNHPDQVDSVQEEVIDLDAIYAGWGISPHAHSHVVDDSGNNSNCARCHAPANWIPSMDDMPESCSACKFEVEDPPPFLPEEGWEHIPCKVCHQVDKKENILPEYSWLEIAQIGEYVEVSSADELCRKCHEVEDLPGHLVVQVDGAHSDYQCIKCHDAHDTAASCSTAGCHESIEPTTVGHDDDHQLVSCSACHDGGNLMVGPNEDLGYWTTYFSSQFDGEELIPFTSHNIVLEVLCERCHYVENPWDLSMDITK
ncbi:MAG: cytochrome c3 family protein [Chloroflexota bacterium]